MSVSVSASPPAPSPSPAARAAVALALRLTLGLALLEAGVVGHLRQRQAANLGAPAVRITRFYPGFGMRPAPSLPEWEVYAAHLPYVEVALGVALLLGFLTTASAVAAAVWPVLTAALRIVVTFMVLSPDDPQAVQFLEDSTLLDGPALAYLAVAAAVAWLSSSGGNAVALDRLIWPPPASPDEPPAVAARARETAGAIPDVPAVGAVNPVGRGFAPDLFVEGVPAGDDARG